MAFKSILTVVINADGASAQIDAAVALARREDAHLDVLCLGIDRTQNGYYYIGAAPMAPVILQETLDQARDDAKATEAAVRKRLEAEDIRWAIDTGIAQSGVRARSQPLGTLFRLGRPAETIRKGQSAGQRIDP